MLSASAAIGEAITAAMITIGAAKRSTCIIPTVGVEAACERSNAPRVAGLLGGTGRLPMPMPVIAMVPIGPVVTVVAVTPIWPVVVAPVRNAAAPVGRVEAPAAAARNLYDVRRRLGARCRLHRCGPRRNRGPG